MSPAGPLDLQTDVAPAVDALAAVLARAKAADIPYLFAIVDAQDLPTSRALQASGFELIETRVAAYVRLEPASERYDVRMATAADVPSLSRAASEVYCPFDRFHADMAIEPANAARLMQEWVRASVVDGFADTMIVPNVEEPEAFLALKHHREHWDGWGVKLAQPTLSAVSPRHPGWFRRLLSELGEYSRSEGADHVAFTSQITNRAVMRSWERLGYGVGKGQHVFRRLL